MSRKAWAENFKKMKLRSKWRGCSDNSSKGGNDLDYLHSLISSLNATVNTRSKECRLWKDVKYFIVNHPDEVCDPNGTTDRRGRTCLHAICAKRPPADVVKAYVLKIKQLHRKQKLSDENAMGLLTTKDHHGRTPLAICCAQNANNSVIQIILEECPFSAKIFDNKGYLPLHLACYSPESDPTVVKLLLDAYPDATRITQETKITSDSSQGTPLHLAIENFASIDIVKLLVDVAPDTLLINRRGNIPLTLAIKVNSHIDIIRHLVGKNTKSTLSRDNNRREFPLYLALECPSIETFHLLCIHTHHEVFDHTDSIGRNILHRSLELNRYSITIVRSILERNPQLARKKSLAGITPLHMVYHHFVKNLKRKAAINSERSRLIWDVLVLILNAHVHDTVDSNVSQILHSALQTDVPLEVVQYILSKYPNQVEVVDNGKKNSLPVSLVLQGPAKEKFEIMKLLLNIYPKAAQIPDNVGRYLLHYATKDNFLQIDALREIYNLAPHTLTIPDPDTRLYPFMLAAAKKDQKQGRQSVAITNITYRVTQEINDLLQINMVLELLLAFPAVITHH